MRSACFVVIATQSAERDKVLDYRCKQLVLVFLHEAL